MQCIYKTLPAIIPKVSITVRHPIFKSPGSARTENWIKLAKRIRHRRPINLRAVRKTLSIGRLIASRSRGLDVRSHAPAIVDLRPPSSPRALLVIVSFLGVYIVRVQGPRNGLTLFQAAIAACFESSKASRRSRISDGLASFHVVPRYLRAKQTVRVYRHRFFATARTRPIRPVKTRRREVAADCFLAAVSTPVSQDRFVGSFPGIVDAIQQRIPRFAFICRLNAIVRGLVKRGCRGYSLWM